MLRGTLQAQKYASWLTSANIYHCSLEGLFMQDMNLLLFGLELMSSLFLIAMGVLILFLAYMYVVDRTQTKHAVKPTWSQHGHRKINMQEHQLLTSKSAGSSKWVSWRPRLSILVKVSPCRCPSSPSSLTICHISRVFELLRGGGGGT